MMNTPSQEYISYICSLYNDTYDDRIEDSKPSGSDWKPGTTAQHKSLNSFQKELEEKGIKLSTSKIKKILITGGMWTTERSREIAELYEQYTAEGMDTAAAVKAIADEIETSIVTVNTNLPYEVLSLAKEQGKITRREVEEAFDCGSTKAYKMLKALCEEGLLVQQKSGNQTVYLPVK